MATDSQHLLEAHIPWYRTRKFWFIVLSLQLITNIFLLSPLFNFQTNALSSIVSLLSFSSGSGIVFLVYATVINSPPSPMIVSTVIYIPLLFLLLHGIVKNKKYIVVRALIILISMISSLVTGYLIAVSFG